MKKILHVLVISLLVFLVSGCSQKSLSRELTISAAASLTDCMADIQEAFKGQYPDIALKFNFGSSGALKEQIAQGAPVDVFFSAGKAQVQTLIESGLVEEESTKEVLRNKLVLITGKDDSKSLSFKTLGETDLEKLAVGDFGSVPVGQYTEEVFKALGLTDQLKDNLVYAKDVREVLFWVETGNAEAGIVYETDAKVSQKVIICDSADESWHDPIIYPVALIKGSPRLEEAKLFTAFLTSKEAQDIFRAYGFTPQE
ncbi:MAG: molybdate ABC transporter substrate-binding protein [Clostridiales bacterium]|uniref:Molybdate ABC transporter substrate-binding protein n=1 Tax=Zhenhengia yiwuensis TaxID=2763666 RepID=A0A926ED53_9FIRM|nr:molybdate ABC transporter substrate-binding protein [Zhenhengia yiwuensis]MBC8578801.1 molybdate ABC transporter substrate-binding protein [Zhenhengia yiwuensis]MDU6361396.1 molybdate ABC transporter substrate-binding protein [Clostridiales bacterium]